MGLGSPVAGVHYPGNFAAVRAWFPDDEACLDRHGLSTQQVDMLLAGGLIPWLRERQTHEPANKPEPCRQDAGPSGHVRVDVT